MDLKALQDCIIVEPEIEASRLIQLIKAGRTGFGKVLAIGPDAKDIRLGDKVCFGEFVGQDFKHAGTGYLVMREQHVLGVIEE